MKQHLDDIQLKQFDRAYFIGIGGIGMSALARYFNHIGWNVAGYDKTPSTLTKELKIEGITIHFEDLGNNIPEQYKESEKTLVIYTPAIPKSFEELHFFKSNNSYLLKRSEVLGLLTRASKGIGVAGTHGKTTTSSMLAHILNESHIKCNAFLGGIATNFNSNFLINNASEFTVIEADEFDRSFLQLNPFASIITSIDPDHLDIYDDAATFREGFQQYAQLTSAKGCLVVREGITLRSNATQISYAINSETADYGGSNLRVEGSQFFMDVKTPRANFKSVALGIPGIHNAENALACFALLEFIGCNEIEIRNGLKSFKGVKRRFEYHIKTDDLIYIDDYAHHPTEIHALIASVRLLYPAKKIIGVFQPHLFSRTRDFFDDFAKELSHLDELILLPIYPAREEPIPGVTSENLLKEIALNQKNVLNATETLEYLSNIKEGVVLTIGAGDIDRIIEPLKNVLS
jgi:UDP-N-acetylmuramate--alanine ligase